MLIKLSQFENFIEGRIWHIRDHAQNFIPPLAKIVDGDTIFDCNIVYGIVEADILDEAHKLAPVLRGIKTDHPIAKAYRAHDAYINEHRDYQYSYVQRKVIDGFKKNETTYAFKVGGSANNSEAARWVKNYLEEQEAFIRKYSGLQNVLIEETCEEIRAINVTEQFFGHRLMRELIALGVPFKGRNIIPDTYSSIEEWHKFNQYNDMYENAKNIIDPDDFKVNQSLPYTHVYLKRKGKVVPVRREPEKAKPKSLGAIILNIFKASMNFIMNKIPHFFKKK